METRFRGATGAFGGRGESRSREWPEDRSCKNTDLSLFFPVEASATPETVIRMCAKCPARSECLEYAIEGGERWGLWGGLNARERERLASNRRAGRTGVTQCPPTSRTQRFNEHLMLGEDPYGCAVCVSRRIEQASRHSLREAARKAREVSRESGSSGDFQT